MSKEYSFDINGVNYTVTYNKRKNPDYWYCRIEVENEDENKYTPDGKKKRKYKTISDTDEAMLKSKIRDYFAEISSVTESREIFTKDIMRWLKLEYLNVEDISPNTFDRYEQILQFQLIPEAEKLEHKKLCDITAEDCKIMLKNIRAATSESTCKKARTLLIAYFDDKVFDETIKKNPARYKKRGSKRGKKSKITPPSPSGVENSVILKDNEIEKIEDVIYNGYDIEGKNSYGEFTAHNKVPQGEFFVFMLNTGIRAGEAVALKYSDIDFKKGTMSINNNVIYAKNRNAEGEVTGGYTRIEGPPKTDESLATVRINKKAVEILKKMRTQEPKGYNGYILHDTRKSSEKFTAQNNISPHALYMRWQNVCKYAGIKPRGLHCLRHTCASRLFAVTQGNAVMVAELLRHSDVAFTEREYINIIKQYRESILKEFEI